MLIKSLRRLVDIKPLTIGSAEYFSVVNGKNDGEVYSFVITSKVEVLLSLIININIL
jgi:hypothetical protein